MAVLLALVLTLAVATSHGVSTGDQDLQQLWSLPLGLGNNAKTNLFVSTVDENTIYVSDTRGAIFAVSATGQLLWSNPGNSSLGALLLFPKAGILVAGWSATSTFAHMMGLSTVDGSVVWTTETAFTPYYAANENSAVFISESTPAQLWSLDAKTGNVRWNVTTQFEYSTAIAVSDSLVVVFGIIGSNQVFGTFDIATGAFLCLFAGLATPGAMPNIPVVGDLIGMGNNSLPLVVVNGRTCAWVQNFVPNQLASALAFVAGSNLFVTVSNDTVTSSGKWEWNVTMLDRSGSIAWVLNWPTFEDSALAPQFAFQLANSTDIVLQIYGRLGAVDTVSGKLRWIFSHRVPIAPPNALNQALFPLGNGQYFVPNLQGFIVYDLSTNGIKYLQETSPPGVTAGFIGAEGRRIVVTADLTTGSLIAFRRRPSPVKELWSLQLGIGVPADSTTYVFASDGTNYYVADSRGALFAVNAAGQLLWSNPGTSTVIQLLISNSGSQVFAVTSLGNITAIDATSGVSQWTSTSPDGIASVVVTPGRLLYNTAGNTVVALKTSDGSVLWTYVMLTQFPIAWDGDEDSVIISGALPTQMVEVVDAATGARRCTLNNTGVVPGPTLAGGTLLVMSPTTAVGAVSTTTCLTQENLSAKYGATPSSTLAFNHEQIFVFNATLNATGAAVGAQLIRVVVDGNGGWTSESISTPQTHIGYALQPTAFNKNAVIAQVGFGPSTFAAVDLKTGAVQWTVSQALPLNPYGNLGEYLFPLGHQILFVPNLEGYVVFNVAQAEVEQVVESRPINGAASLQSTAGTPVVVVIDVNSGALLAFERNPEY